MSRIFGLLDVARDPSQPLALLAVDRAAQTGVYAHDEQRTRCRWRSKASVWLDLRPSSVRLRTGRSCGSFLAGLRHSSRRNRSLNDGDLRLGGR